ncbi:phenylalanine--tRNA ligase subunit beta [candidate division WOR-1 bacterium RIFOXYC2_FULL_37_10]|uniref:Phenylalanine--tRNA ligase beta subunit n=1 Tax=candidate division WOR-1 bacterium RIFOXYB2_FULL_37_13 TaxID=1802579 RepID=A0A1F4SP87_UNCSA|nr:MAG: phenylalanine--tRNA ligase subunit beta [candidate division WOR-1 bacterium RIFOXYB2_FULL_37_13]OGC37076.1 MAG: phenylalanine--tRNA ligase subunit beta [candidate division WOR-1 bacterium RIFOXYC2_FULL_37_10]
MKVSIEWLKDFVNINMKAEELADRLTMAGLETFVHSFNVLDVDILPNRGDCQSVLGISREVCAITGTKPRVDKIKVRETKEKISSYLKVDIRDKKLCSRYMARVIKNVKIKESPAWLKGRLEAFGIRSINNVVDVTNYILLGYGQPMHAFDADKLHFRSGGLKQIIVRKASTDEAFKTLDGTDHKLAKDMLVISDSERAIALAGVMGGKNTEVSETTTNIILESAYFNPVSISRTAKEVKLRTESSSRFEKGVDLNMVEEALDRGAQMIADLSGGEILSGRIDIKEKKRDQKLLELRFSRMDQVLGIKILPEVAIKILKRLGFEIIKKETKKIKVGVPSFRAGDIEREIDLIEEVSRINDYNKILPTMPRFVKKALGEDSLDKISRVKDILIGCGLYEAQTFSIVHPESAGVGALKISNPMVYEESVMRTDIIPGILKVISHNARHQEDDIRIFEVGKVFVPGDPHHEKEIVAGAITFANSSYFFIKGVVETLISEFIDEFEVSPVQNNWVHPNESAKIDNIGWFGLLHPEAAKKWDFGQKIFVFQIDLEELLKAKKDKKFSKLPKFPRVKRDLAMFVSPQSSHKEIINLIKDVGGEILEEVKLFDVYKNSRAYTISFRDKNATLTDDVVSERFLAIQKELEDKLGVQIRK